MADTHSATQTQTQTETKRKITIISTRGEKKVIEFEGNQWSGLKSKLEKEGYDLKNMKCVEGINKTTLEHPEATVPDGNFALFLMPIQNKGGGESRDKVKAFATENKDAVKAHFGNWTIKKEDELAVLLKTYKPGKVTAPAKESKKKEEKKASKPASSKKVKAETVKEDTEKGVSTASAKSALSYDEVYDAAQKLSAGEQVRLVNALKKLNQVEEDVDYDKELKNLAKGFKDVKSF
jgi:hypothetical protein